MLTVNPSPSSLPRPHHYRRSLSTHLPHHHRRRSLSHPAPSDPQDGKQLSTATLRSHVEDEDEEEDDEDEEDELGVQAESRERLAAFVLKETSGESSDDEGDESGEQEDEDGSSSASSSSSTPQLKPTDNIAAAAGKRTVTFHSSVPHTAALPPSTVFPVVHRKLMKPSSRQHKVSPHHYSNHQGSNKPYAIRLHRRKPHNGDSNVLLLADDSQQSVQPAVVSEQNTSSAAVEFSTIIAAADIDTLTNKPAPLVPPSSATRYSLFVAILRRSSGRDKLIRSAYFGSNHLRALVHLIHSQLSSDKRLRSILSLAPSFSSPVLIRLFGLAASFCQSADTQLGRLNEVLGAARQLLRLGRWIDDLESLNDAWTSWCTVNTTEGDEQSSNERRTEQATAMLELINAFLSVTIDLMDDIEWLAEHRILPSSLSSPAGLASALLWFVTVCIDIPFTLHTLSALRAVEGRGSERRAERLSLLRYGGDLLYSGSLVAEHMGWSGGESGESDGAVRWRVGDSGGLVSALVSLYKLSRSETLHRSVH